MIYALTRGLNAHCNANLELLPLPDAMNHSTFTFLIRMCISDYMPNARGFAFLFFYGSSRPASRFCRVNHSRTTCINNHYTTADSFTIPNFRLSHLRLAVPATSSAWTKAL